MNKDNSGGKTLSYYMKGPNELKNLKMNSTELREYICQSELITYTAKSKETEYDFPSFTEIIQEHIKTHDGKFPTQKEFIEECCLSSEYKNALEQFKQEKDPIQVDADDNINVKNETAHFNDEVEGFEKGYKMRCARSYLSLARDEELCLTLKERFLKDHTTVYYNTDMDKNGIDIAIMHTYISKDRCITTKNIAILNTMNTPHAIEKLLDKYERLDLNENYTQIIINLISTENMKDREITFYSPEAIDEIEKIIRNERGLTQPIIIIDGKISEESLEDLKDKMETSSSPDLEKNNELEEQLSLFDMDY